MLGRLHTRILLWIIVPLAVLLAGLAYIGVNSHQASMREMVAERDGAMARVAAAQLSALLADGARRLAETDPRRPASWDLVAFDGGMALLDAQGEPRQAFPSVEVWQERARYLPTGGNWSLPFKEQDHWRVLAVKQVVVDAEMQLLVGALTLWPLESWSQSMTNGAHGTAVAYLVNREGEIIAHPNSAQVGRILSAHNGIKDVMRGEAGAAFHHDERGAELVVGYAPVEPTGWGLLIEEAWEQVLAPMFQYSVLLPAVLALVAVLALALISFGLGQIVRPLQSLAAAANRIAYGDYEAAGQPVGGLREIEELRETINRMALQVREAQAAMQGYVGAITRGQEEERKRLARELHDDTIQALIALQQRIELTKKALNRDPAAAAARLEELAGLLSETLTSVRRYVHDLRPTYLEELGLIPALEMLCRSTGQELNARFSVTGEERRLDAERELALYRIVQEALHNAVRYARAKEISVTLAFSASEVTVTVEDDGTGFELSNAPGAYVRSGHFGLMGMQERASLLGGRVYVKSAPGQGTRVVAYLPLEGPFS